MIIKSYKDLDAYKKAHEVAKLVYDMTKSFPKEELYGISSQLRRSAVSITYSATFGTIPVDPEDDADGGSDISGPSEPE
jgi:23S rRNA-intervening sequence protein